MLDFYSHQRTRAFIHTSNTTSFLTPNVQYGSVETPNTIIIRSVSQLMTTNMIRQFITNLDSRLRN